MLWLSNLILLGPAHQAWPWEEQTSCPPCPNRFVDTGLGCHSLCRGVDAGEREGTHAQDCKEVGEDLEPSLNPWQGQGPVLNATKPSDVTLYPTPQLVPSPFPLSH